MTQTFPLIDLQQNSKIWPAEHLAITYLISYLSSDKNDFLILFSVFLLLNILSSVSSE